MTSREIIERICKDNNLTFRMLAQITGLPEQYLYDINGGKIKKITAQKSSKITKQFPKYSPMWLMTGEGEILVSSPNSKQGLEQSTQSSASPAEGEQEYGATVARGLPLIPIDAVAGFNGVDVQGVRLEDCSRYVVPEFAELHAEYMIRVSGSSMYPKYSNGDLLACRRVAEVTFLQWGKVYVLDSNQGAMVKRLFPCEDNNEVVECRSDNPNYPPFRLLKSEIRSVSIVVGVIRFE